MEQSDIELMIQYQKGSEVAFNELYRRHKGKVYGYILKKTGNSEMTSEIFQDVFHKLHTNKMKFDGKREFLPWLFVICHNLIIDHIRKIRTNIDPLENDIPVTDEAFESVKEMEAVTRLSDKEQTIIQLKFDQGYDYKEISNELGITNSSARKIYSRAIGKLKKLLGAQS
ncbi:MAG: sigma-70 family RNA polymerase sigma factor [Bacteriovoracaceae bacterium]|nr:sigma-70 family RNA polymerase sigma factor [Bacteriovoracaceae bacterium]